jgi:hypothetical protein
MTNSICDKRKRLESGASERSDDWCLLDNSEQSVTSVPSSDQVESSKFDGKAGRQQRNKFEPIMAPSRSTKLRRNEDNNNNNKSYNPKYHDKEPLDRGNLSPTLIYISTIAYSLLPMASLLAFFTFVCLLFTKFWYITIIYYSYLIFDAKTCNRGGRRWNSVYKAKFWSYLAAYFPIKLRYSDTFQLDAEENYILNYHPHGISAFGCVSAFATDALGFSSLFPGVRPRFMVHETSFLVPIMRETFSLRGDCSVNSNSFDYILGKRWRQSSTKDAGQKDQEARGNLLALCGGGLAEADLSDMETLKVVCATRKGFVKKSLIHGAHLIPCIAFGENSVFKKVNFKPDSLLYRLEKKWYQLFKFKHPIYYGRSLLFGDQGKGFVPYKRPITVVMGDPIRVERVEQPSQEQIDQLHSKYMERLRSLYEDNKQELCDKFDTQLQIV